MEFYGLRESAQTVEGATPVKENGLQIETWADRQNRTVAKIGKASERHSTQGVQVHHLKGEKVHLQGIIYKWQTTPKRVWEPVVCNLGSTPASVIWKGWYYAGDLWWWRRARRRFKPRLQSETPNCLDQEKWVLSRRNRERRRRHEQQQK